LPCLLCAILLPFALHPLILEFMASLQWFFPPAPKGIAELMQELKTVDLGLAILAIAVTPAFCEEIAFRGFLLSGFQRKGKIPLAILLSSFAFGIIHMIPQQVFNATLLGILLGAMCVQTRSLWPGVCYHFVHNSLVVLHDRFGKKVPTGQAWSYFFRWEEESLRYQPALLCLVSLVSIGLLYRLLRSSPTLDSKDPL
jgi:sodium transport system permease protein